MVSFVPAHFTLYCNPAKLYGINLLLLDEMNWRKVTGLFQNFSSLTQTSQNHVNQMFFDMNGVVQKTVDIKIQDDGKLVVAETANGVTLSTYFNKA